MNTEKATPIALQMPTEEAAPKVVYDLAALDTVKDSNKGATMELLHPTQGTELGIQIHLLGKDSDTFKSVQAKQGRKRTDKLKKSHFKGEITNADMEKDGVELLAACTTGWDGLILGGQHVPFSEDNAIAVYTKFPWIKEQVDVAIGDRALFTKA